MYTIELLILVYKRLVRVVFVMTWRISPRSEEMRKWLNELTEVEVVILSIADCNEEADDMPNRWSILISMVKVYRP